MANPWDNDPIVSAAKPAPQQGTNPWDNDPIVSAKTNVQQKPVQEPNFIARVGQDIEKRRQIGKDIDADTGQNKYLSEFQKVGKVGAGLVGDVVGEGVKSAAPYVEKASTAIMNRLPSQAREYGLGQVKNTILDSPEGKMGIAMAQKGAENYKKWAEQNPRIARTLESAVDIASVIPAVKIGGSAAKATAEATTIPQIAKGIASPSMGAIQNTLSGLDKSAQATVNELKNSGAVFHPGVGGKIANELERTTAGITGELANRAKPAIDKIKDGVEQLKSGNNEIANLFYLQKSLKEIASEGGDAAPIASAAVKKIDKVLSAPGMQNLISRPEAAGLIKKFNAQYSQYKNYEALVDTITPKEGTASLSSKQMRNNLSKLANSDGITYFSPEIQDMIKEGAKAKTSEKVLETIGSLKHALTFGGKASGLPGLEIGAALMTGHPAAAAGIAGVVGAHEGARQIRLGTTADILNKIKNGK